MHEKLLRRRHIQCVMRAGKRERSLATGGLKQTALEHERCAQGDVLAVRYLRDVSAVLHLRSLASGTLLQAVRLPGLGSVETSGRRESPVMFFSYNSLTDPGATYMCANLCAIRR